jgi:mono/diheme cytochrome c family protein
MNLIKIFLFMLSVTLFIAACNQASPTPNKTNTAVTNLNKTTEVTPAQPAAPVDEPAMAKELYAKNCMICHRDSGKGGKVTIEGKSLNPEDLTKEKFKVASDEKLIGYVNNGVEDEGMPAFKGKLTADEINSIIKHVRTLQK